MEFRKMLMITLYAEQKKKDTDLQNSLLDSVGEGEGGTFQENSIETCILSRVKQITSPGWMHETSARTWGTGKTQRARVEREVGEGIGMGNTCKPMAVSFQCMTKFTTKKRKEKKRKRKPMAFHNTMIWKYNIPKYFRNQILQYLQTEVSIISRMKNVQVHFSFIKSSKHFSRKKKCKCE